MHRGHLGRDPNCFPLKQKACTDPFEYRMEVFEPPYLFLPQPRPEIIKTPLKLSFTSKFRVMVKDSAIVDKAVFIRYSTSTHSTNFDQRYVEAIIISRNESSLYVEAPLNGNIAPPGNYHLFLMNNGKPSIGVTILVGNGDVVNEDPPVNAVAFEDVVQKNNASNNLPVLTSVFLGILGLLLL